MAEKRLVVTFGEKSKLIVLDMNDIANTIEKIRLKFNIDGDCKLLAKCEGVSKFVDIDIDDEDDVYVLQHCSELLVSVEQKVTESESSVYDEESLDESLTADSEASISSPSAHSTPRAKHYKKDLVLDIDQLLNDNPKGESILEEYAANNTLTPQSRRNLVNIVTSGLVKTCRTPYYPLKHEKTSCALAIVERFPSLKNKYSKTGYEHFFSDKGRQSGYIQDRLKNLRRYIPESAKKRTSTANTSNELPAKQMELGGIVVEPLPDENATKLASFCKRAAPDLKKDIVKAMADIHGNFSKWILEEAPTAYEVLQEYPRFKDIDELVNQHFRIKFSSDISKQLLLKWESVIAPVIMKLAASTTTADVHHLYGECHVDVSEELNSEVLAMYSFLLLVLFLPSTPRNRGSQKQTMKLLIDFQPIGVVLEEYLLQKRNQTQPYLLCIGTKKAPSQFFIIVDSHAIPCQENIVSAIDKLFKLHYVFNIHYAQQLRMFYMFMDSVVYGIVPMNTDTLPNKIIELNAAIEATSTEA